MTTTARKSTAATTEASPWQGFQPGLWQREIDVRDFIQQNFHPYEGDESFLRPATKRTKGLWGKLTKLFVEERGSKLLYAVVDPERKLLLDLDYTNNS